MHSKSANGVMPSSPVFYRECRLAWAKNCGVRIFPMKSGRKSPVFSGWRWKASRDSEQHATWLDEYPDCNFGFELKDGLCCVQVTTYARRRHLDLYFDTNTYSVSYPHGNHLFFYRYDEDFIPSMKLERGIALRGHGKWIQCPYSRLDSPKRAPSQYYLPLDSNGRPDQADIGTTFLSTIAPLPEWIAESIAETRYVIAIERREPVQEQEEEGEEQC